LLDNEYLHEKLVDDEKKKGHKECDDGYWQGIFFQKCHNKGHLTFTKKLQPLQKGSAWSKWLPIEIARKVICKGGHTY
jgi:hypothetical protein